MPFAEDDKALITNYTCLKVMVHEVISRIFYEKLDERQ